MSDIVNIKDIFFMDGHVFGSAIIPMNSHDLAVYGAGAPVTHWFVVGVETVPGRYDVSCFAVDAGGNGHIETADFEVQSIRWNPDSEFRRILFQICSPQGLDELIKG